MSAAVLKLIQGSEAWHKHRAQFRNASESAAVMGLNPWQTPYQLWLVRTGRLEVPVTAPMQHGTQLEPRARAAYEEQTGSVMQPLVLTEGDYSASLDGITLDGDLIVEIKCPYKGQASALWQAVSVGEVPEHYSIQVQHQMMVSGAASAHLWVFDGSTGLLVEIQREEATMAAIRAAWDAFQTYLDTDTPPPLTDRDTVERSDPAWTLAAGLFVEAKRKAEEAAESLDRARERLVSLASHASESGHGVTVTRFFKQGNVDYKKVPELKVVDLDRYRAAGRVEVRVTVAK
jgi:putative phage-type endonuclease